MEREEQAGGMQEKEVGKVKGWESRRKGCNGEHKERLIGFVTGAKG